MTGGMKVFFNFLSGFFSGFLSGRGAVCVIGGLLVCSSCATTVYYPVHHFAQREEKPVKKGIVEFTVLRKAVVSPPPGVIKDWEAAEKKGREDTDKSIKDFCGGKHSVKAVSKETRLFGLRGRTSSYYGSYMGFSTTNITPVYKTYTKLTFQCD